ncbi:MAG: DUF6174 domain-containing protein [Anaerolineae bacterium]|nr:DUF6174 domain-containing protein [Anaerolineae bacterium]
MRQLIILFWLLVLGAAGSGCRAETSGPEGTPTQRAYELQLEEARAAWEASRVEAYTMRVRYRHPGWHVQVLDVRVEDSQATVIAHSCVPRASCTVHEVSNRLLTIENVFQEAVAAATSGQIEHLVIHNKYRFPRIVTVGGDAVSWEISNFRVLK